MGEITAAEFSSLGSIAVIIGNLAHIIRTQTNAALYNALGNSGYLLINVVHNGSELNRGIL